MLPAIPCIIDAGRNSGLAVGMTLTIRRATVFPRSPAPARSRHGSWLRRSPWSRFRTLQPCAWSGQEILKSAGRHCHGCAGAREAASRSEQSRCAPAASDHAEGAGECPRAAERPLDRKHAKVSSDRGGEHADTEVSAGTDGGKREEPAAARAAGRERTQVASRKRLPRTRRSVNRKRKWPLPKLLRRLRQP